MEIRGTDAAGMWGIESKAHPSIIYHKAPIKSSDFIHNSIWNKIQKLNPNLLLVHARQTSPGVGHASNNSNNHPFVNSNKQIGLVHNGKIHECSFLKDKYEMKTGCDSEILLRMYEAAMDYEHIKVVSDIIPQQSTPLDVLQRMNGIRDIWSITRQASMAVAIGELLDDGRRSLWLFHNDKRPIWMADLREALGQIFFFSTPDIWHNALMACKNFKDIAKDSQKLFELPTEEIWYFEIDKDHPTVNNNTHFRFEIEKKESDDDWIVDKFYKIPNKPIKYPIISNLDEKEMAPEMNLPIDLPPVDLILHKGIEINNVKDLSLHYRDKGYVVTEHQNDYPWGNQWVDGDWPIDPNADVTSGFDGHTEFSGRYNVEDDHTTKLAIEDVERLCVSIRERIDMLETDFTNLAFEGSIGVDTFVDVYEALTQTDNDLQGTLQFLKNR